MTNKLLFNKASHLIFFFKKNRPLQMISVQGSRCRSFYQIDELKTGEDKADSCLSANEFEIL